MYLVISIALISIILLTIYFHNKHLRKSKAKQQEITRLEKERLHLDKLLNEAVSLLSIQELKDFISELREFSLGEVSKDKVQEKLQDAKTRLKEKKHEKKLDEIYQRKQLLEQEVEELNYKKYQKQKELRNNKEAILEHLDIEENSVFLMEDLDEEEIKALEEVGFKKVNEYDPILNKNYNFLAKQILNHSPTHTFLVGRIKELLLQYLENDEVQVHDTRDADITFKIEKKTYALEIETGNLLRKKDQLREKVDYLNRKYKKNWYFVVSNRDLMSKYRKYGKCTQRSGVRQIIDKLADSSHLLVEGVNDDLSSVDY